MALPGNTIFLFFNWSHMPLIPKIARFSLQLMAPRRDRNTFMGPLICPLKTDQFP